MQLFFRVVKYKYKLSEPKSLKSFYFSLKYNLRKSRLYSDIFLIHKYICVYLFFFFYLHKIICKSSLSCRWSMMLKNKQIAVVFTCILFFFACVVAGLCSKAEWLVSYDSEVRFRSNKSNAIFFFYNRQNW